MGQAFLSAEPGHILEANYLRSRKAGTLLSSAKAEADLNQSVNNRSNTAISARVARAPRPATHNYHKIEKKDDLK